VGIGPILSIFKVTEENKLEKTMDISFEEHFKAQTSVVFELINDGK